MVHPREKSGQSPNSEESKASTGLRPREHPVSVNGTLVRRVEAVGILVASFVLAALVVSHRTAVEHILHHVGWLAMPLAVLVFAIVASAPFSVTDALAIMNGVLFGPLWGSVVNALGLVLAAVIGYYVALRTSDAFDVKAQVERLPSWARRFQIGSPMFLIAVRIIPGLGGTIATQTAAALRVPLFRQVYTMCAIAVPICTVLAVGGDWLSDQIDAHIVTPAQHYAERHHLHMPHRRHTPRASAPASPRPR